MTRTQQRRLIGFVFSVLVVGYSLLQQEAASRASGGVEVSTSTVSAPVLVVSTSTNAMGIRAVDGDTIAVRIDGQTEDAKIRLLGVNTPESVDPRRPVECFGKEASKFTAGLVTGKRVRLEEDAQADNIDKYGRLLRIVVLEDGRELNATLVKEGYASAYVSFPMTAARKALLRSLEAEAKAAGRGLWNAQTCNGAK